MVDRREIMNKTESEAEDEGVTNFTVQAPAMARKDLDEDLLSLGNDFLHMLQHISDIEGKMIAELKSRMRVEAPRARVILVPPTGASTPNDA
jgi:hypothetical protein